jgi:hypothetical protein
MHDTELHLSEVISTVWVHLFYVWEWEQVKRKIPLGRHVTCIWFNDLLSVFWHSLWFHNTETHIFICGLSPKEYESVLPSVIFYQQYLSLTSKTFLQVHIQLFFSLLRFEDVSCVLVTHICNPTHEIEIRRVKPRKIVFNILSQKKPIIEKGCWKDWRCRYWVQTPLPKKKIDVRVLAHKDKDPISKPTTITKENQECVFAILICVYVCIKIWINESDEKNIWILTVIASCKRSEYNNILWNCKEYYFIFYTVSCSSL